MDPRRRKRLLLLAAVVVASVPCCLCGLPVYLFMRSPSPHLEGRIWTAEDAAYQLVDRGVAVDVTPVPAGVLAVVVWEGRKGTVLIRRHESEEAARQAAADGFPWGRLTFRPDDGDPASLDGVKAILR